MFYAAIFFTTLVLLFLVCGVRKPTKFPPGPKWYPIVGSALQVAKLKESCGLLCKVVDELARRYVNPYGLYGLKIGKDMLVIAYTGDAIQEMMTNEDLDGRPEGIFFRERTFNSNLGILLSDGEMWSDQRRFILRHLKDFGFARSGMIRIIQNEALELLRDLHGCVRDMGGKQAQIALHDIFPVYVLNTLWCMMSSKRYDRSSNEVPYLLDMFFELFKNIDMTGALFGHFPFLRFIAPDYSGYSAYVESHRRIYAFLRKEIEQHRKTFPNYDSPRDLMDIYLREQQQPNAKPNFTEESLLATCLDMFLAGSETTSKSLGFAFAHLVHNPAIQERAYAEIRDAVGLERIPEWSDRTKLPYCEAIILEAVRMFVSYTFGLPHRALCDTRLSGFFIPKDTMILACFRGMLTNSHDFPNHQIFDPERYLVDGKLKLPEAYNPFGFGRHRCMGDQLARQNLLIFTATVLQNFRLVSVSENPPNVEPIDGATASIEPYDVILIPRNGTVLDQNQLYSNTMDKYPEV